MDSIVYQNGAATFRGFAVEEREVRVAGMTLRLAAMSDATHLLDVPDCAQRFLEADMAPYGVELWPAGVMLADYIANCDREPHKALEIGCGLGLVSLVASRLGWSVVAGDHEPSALVFARHNAERNGAGGIEFTQFDWNRPPQGKQYDRILGADVLYQLSNHRPILGCLNELLTADGVALISDPNRGVADRFSDQARNAGFTVESIPVRAEIAGGKVAEGRVFRLSR